MEYRQNGRKVSRQQWERGLQDNLRKAAVDAIEKKLRTVHCPVHGSPPTSIARRTVGGRVSWDIQGCCNRLVEAVRRAA